MKRKVPPFSASGHQADWLEEIHDVVKRHEQEDAGITKYYQRQKHAFFRLNLALARFVTDEEMRTAVAESIAECEREFASENRESKAGAA